MDFQTVRKSQGCGWAGGRSRSPPQFLAPSPDLSFSVVSWSLLGSVCQSLGGSTLGQLLLPCQTELVAPGSASTRPGALAWNPWHPRSGVRRAVCPHPILLPASPTWLRDVVLVFVSTMPLWPVSSVQGFGKCPCFLPRGLLPAVAGPAPRPSAWLRLSSPRSLGRSCTLPCLAVCRDPPASFPASLLPALVLAAGSVASSVACIPSPPSPVVQPLLPLTPTHHGLQLSGQGEPLHFCVLE